jgi:hypothetical protein
LVCVTNLWTWDIELGGTLRIFLLWLSMIWMTPVAHKTTGIITILLIWHFCMISKTIYWYSALIKFIIIIIIIVLIFIQAKPIPLPRGLRRLSVAARFWDCVFVPPEVCLLWVSVLSGRGLCVGLITILEESYGVLGVRCVWSRSPVRVGHRPEWCRKARKKTCL